MSTLRVTDTEPLPGPLSDPLGLATADPRPRCSFGQPHTWFYGFTLADGTPAEEYVKCAECGQIEWDGPAEKVHLHLQIENCYPDEIVNTTADVTVDAPWDWTPDDLADWAATHLATFTGTGRTGHASYTVTITDSPDEPRLTGATWGWEG